MTLNQSTTYTSIAPAAAHGSPQSSSLPQQARRAGFFTRLINRTCVDLASETVDPAAVSLPLEAYTDVDELIAENEQLFRRGSVASSIYSTAEVLTLSDGEDADKLRQENEQLRKRCEELIEQSKLNEDKLQQYRLTASSSEAKLIAENYELRDRCEGLAEQLKLNKAVLQEYISSMPAGDEQLRNENVQLRTRCEDLTEQSKLNQEMFQKCSQDLLTKETEMQALEATVKELQAVIIKQGAKLKVAKTIHGRLRDELKNWEQRYGRLRALGCVPPAPVNEADMDALHCRIEKLESEKLTIHEQLEQQKSATKKLVLDYANETNELSEGLRHAEADAKNKGEQLVLQTSLFRTLHAEYDRSQQALDAERKASAELEKQVSSSHRNGQSQPNDVLAMQLAKAQSVAAEREKLIEKFKTQQQQVVDAYCKDQAAHTQQSKQIDALHAENQQDRKRFEEELKARDQQIQGLERKLGSKTKTADSDKTAELEDKLRQFNLDVEDSVAKRAAEMQFEAEQEAKERIQELEEETMQLKAQMAGLVEAFGQSSGGDVVSSEGGAVGGGCI